MRESQDTKMNYFTIIVSREEGIIGKYPQVITDTKPFEWLLPPLNLEYRFDKFLNFDKYFDIILDDKAILTDVIERASLSWGLVVNERLKKIFVEFNLPQHRFYPINVIHRDISYQYYWFHFYVNLFDYVDNEKTVFEIFISNPFTILEALPLKSEIFFKEKERNLDYKKSIRLREVYFNNAFPFYDIFENNIYGGVFISKKLLDKLLENEITGFEYHEQNFIKV